MTLTSTAVSNRRSQGRSTAMKWSTPGFCKPMALSMPAGVSATRGGGLPGHGSRETPLTMIPPKRPRSKYPAYSRP